MAYTLQSKLGELLNDSAAVKVLEKHAPGITANPMIGLARSISLETLLSMPQVKQYGINKEMVLKVLAEIEAQK